MCQGKIFCGNLLFLNNRKTINFRFQVIINVLVNILNYTNLKQTHNLKWCSRRYIFRYRKKKLSSANRNQFVCEESIVKKEIEGRLCEIILIKLSPNKKMKYKSLIKSSSQTNRRPWQSDDFPQISFS